VAAHPAALGVEKIAAHFQQRLVEAENEAGTG
jgi:hypothetical protein